MDDKTIPGAQTLFRGLAVIEAVAAGARTLASIGGAIGCTRSTTQRLASALLQAGYLRNDPGRGYVLGPKLIQFGFQAREQMPLAAIARPHLEALAARTEDTVHLGIPEGSEVLYLDKLPGQRGLEMRSRVGHRMPIALTGVGKALMLDMDAAEWRRLYDVGLHHPGSRGTPLPWPEYRARMEGYRAAGATIDLAENEIGIHCVAAPVRDAGGGIVAAISVASAAPYMSEARMQSLVPDVIAAARAVSRELGWKVGTTGQDAA
ncbi:D-galactonate regulator, IclR family [Rhodovastum atsumiense]|uniref:IclR family transcriptional regulator n=1 Tax=Rhodovastum atsumiense TaxID=504468 RepID=A0A5M6IQ65_9PROT|nr:IclR family transcriptional regulator [Rhodovastum atsumiense]KAA5610401.1 IclR family transcriptional regulator [Rhodovastum atsumiense]CAH2602917.1 D-galactonate regulator, IclR family [Rhodovastum atsumiense]